MRLFLFLLVASLVSPCILNENDKGDQFDTASNTEANPVEQKNTEAYQPILDDDMVFLFDTIRTIESLNIPQEEMVLLNELASPKEPQSAPKKQLRSISSEPSKSEKIRLDHAKELLGYKKFKKSFIAKKMASKSFKKDFYKSIENHLSKENKKYAKKIMKTILTASKQHEFDPLFVAAVIQTESTFNPEAIGTSGEIGLMQIMPDTASWIAEKENIKYKNKNSLKDPVVNIKLGVAYMAFLRDYFEKNPTRYIAAYNMGANNVKKLVSHSRKPTSYPTRVIKNYKLLYAGFEGIKTSSALPQ
ncbi:MAG: lytic transglycosylase domain-containing protein [Bdellovibrio sp.]